MYDNSQYSSRENLRKVDARFVVKVVFAFFLFSSLILLMNAILADLYSTELWWTATVVLGCLIAFLVLAVSDMIHSHTVHRRMPLTVTEEGLVIGKKRTQYPFDTIEQVVFSTGFVRIHHKDKNRKSKILLLHSEYVWSIKKFKEELEKFCVVKDERPF
jgi:hypothetical protein